MQRRNLASLLSDFDRHGREIAVVAPKGLRRRRTSYGELAEQARRFAAGLEERSIAKGDRVLIWGENSAEWIAAFFGCVLRGVLPVPLDLASAPDFAARVQQEVSPKLVVGDARKVEALASTTPVLSFERFDEALPSDEAIVFPALVPEDPLQIVFTSGTTGEPKGVVHTHRNVLASLEPIEREMQKYLKYERFFHPIRILHTLPLSHVFGQFMGLWVPPLLGAEVHYEPRLVAADLAERIRRNRISVLAAVPRVLDLMQRFAVERFPGLETRIGLARSKKAWQRWWEFRDVHRFFGWKFWAFVCGGAALSPGGEQFWNALGFVVVQGYGMTETTALVSLSHPFRAVPGTIGQILPGREVRLSEEGEVLVRGDTISNATWQQGRLQMQDSDWLATGDLADFDEHGNLRFRGRKKDVIVTSAGLNIYPEDLEAALNRQPGVKASAIIETQADHGPEPLAAIVTSRSRDAAAAVQAANRELADFQQIRRWIIWPEADLPRTSTGKVLKREVARRIASGEITAGAGEHETGVELNLDSMGRVQLQAQLEQQYGISLDDAALQHVKTREDVQKLVREAPVVARTGRGNRTEGNTYPRWPWNPIQQSIRSAFLTAIAMPLVRFLATPRVKTIIDDWPSPPLLIVCNHVTSYDVPFILYALPRHIRRRVAVAMSGEMILDWRHARNQGHWFLNLVAPLEYWLVTALFNIFPLPQYSGFRRSFAHAGEAVDRGYSVLVFPEGRRSDDGTPQPFKSGAGLLWKGLGIPALPVHLAGLGEIKAEGARWFRTGKITVSVGELLQVDPNKSPEELTEELRHGVFGY
ncbi:MAG TPA: AMP-binding protein [Bryobacteraceae bacterium]